MAVSFDNPLKDTLKITYYHYVHQHKKTVYSMNPPDPWKFFDVIYCISVDNRIDRRELVKRQFAAVGLLKRVEFVLVTRHPDNREKGIFESHLICLKKGLAAGAKTILIFEDDVFFRHFDPFVLSAACQHLASMQNWSGLFLGCITNGSRRTSVHSLARVQYRCLTHAYALSASAASRVIRAEWGGIPYDGMLRRSREEFFAIYPLCAYQGHSASDNQTVAIDRIRRVLGGLPFIQKMNEIYQNFKILILAAHLAVLIVLAAYVRVRWW